MFHTWCECAFVSQKQLYITWWVPILPTAAWGDVWWCFSRSEKPTRSNMYNSTPIWHKTVQIKAIFVGHILWFFHWIVLFLSSFYVRNQNPKTTMSARSALITNPSLCGFAVVHRGAVSGWRHSPEGCRPPWQAWKEAGRPPGRPLAHRGPSASKAAEPWKLYFLKLLFGNDTQQYRREGPISEKCPMCIVQGGV